MNRSCTFKMQISASTSPAPSFDFPVCFVASQAIFDLDPLYGVLSTIFHFCHLASPRNDWKAFITSVS